MPDTPTPGEVAYNAWADAMAAHAPWGQPSFAALTPAPDVQRAWEAAAQAVLAMPPADTMPICMHFGHTIHATQGLCGAASAWVAIFPRLVTCQACIALMRPHDRQEVSHG